MDKVLEKVGKNWDQAAVEQMVVEMSGSAESEADLADANAIFYVAGALVRSELRQNNCQACPEILLESDDPLNVDFPENCDESMKQFVEQVSRGGLLQPSSIVFALCLKCWCIFSKIRENSVWKANFLSMSNHKQNFKKLAEILIEKDADLCDLLLAKVSCENGHSVLESVAERFFNCLVKNFVIQLSDAREPVAKRRKIVKLSSKSS